MFYQIFKSGSSKKIFQMSAIYKGASFEPSMVKMSEACFFNAPISPTANTPIPDCPTRFLFLALIAKYFDEISPDPEVSI